MADRWSVEVRQLPKLLSKFRSEYMKLSGREWDGYSFSLKSFLEGKLVEHTGAIHPPIHEDYKEFYSNKIADFATSYVWSETTPERMAGATFHYYFRSLCIPILCVSSGALSKFLRPTQTVFIDVLIVEQKAATSKSTLEVTEKLYGGRPTVVFLSKTYVERGWCLTEMAANFSKGQGKLVLRPKEFIGDPSDFVLGKRKYFEQLTCGTQKEPNEQDIKLIKDHIKERFTPASFNEIIDSSIMSMLDDFAMDKLY